MTGGRFGGRRGDKLPGEYRYLGPDGEGIAGLPDGVGAAMGSEYCVHLLPSPRELAEALSSASSRRVPVVFLTPYFRDAELKRTLPLFRAIPQGSDVDVAVNDWGLLRTLRGLFPWMTLSLGRLLSGQKQCPRIGVSRRLTEEGREWHREGVYSSVRARKYLSAECGVTGYHLDDLPSGEKFSGEALDGTRIYVHSPWAIVTVSDACPWIGGRSSGEITACAGPCRGAAVVLRESSMGADLHLRGKARFAETRPSSSDPSQAMVEWCRIFYGAPP